MKKAIIALGTFVALSAVILGLLTLYVYNLDLGVDYKGRARLDYNWKYYFTKCPKEEYRYNDKMFSFSYPKFEGISPIDEIVDSQHGLIFYEPRLLEIIWHIDEPASIKSELMKYLSLDDKANFLPPSYGFIDWLICESDKEYSDFGKIYSTDVRKVVFKDGNTAILISLWSKTEQRPHYKFVVGITPGGQVFKMRNMVRLNASEESYRKLMGSYPSCTLFPDPARDAKSAYVLRRFLQTFEFKK